MEESIFNELGTFHGYHIERKAYLERALSAAEVIAWNPRKDGLVEFWPSGDREELRYLLGPFANVGARLLVALEKLLREMGGATRTNFLKLHYLVNGLEYCVDELNAEEVEELTADFDFAPDDRLTVRQQFHALTMEHEAAFTE